MPENLKRRCRQFWTTAGARGVCVSFHSVNKDPQPLWPNVGPTTAVTAEEFEVVIRQLAAHFIPLPLSQMVDHLRHKNLPQNSVAVTFDDGFRDNFELAFPVLQHYAVPATIFITPGFVNGDVRPLEYDLSHLIRNQDQLTFEWNGQVHEWRIENNKDREACYKELKGILRPQPYTVQREKLVEMGFDEEVYPPPAYLSWEEVKQLNASPLIEIGSHTYSHQRLDTVNKGLAEQEIARGKTVIEENIGEDVRQFSYPYGGYNAIVKEMVKHEGFNGAVTSGKRAIRYVDTDAFAIPRCELRSPLPQCVRKTADVIRPFVS